MPRAIAPMLLLILVTLSQRADAALRWQDAESWVAQELAPAVVGQLTEQPRFRGQTIRVVAFEDGAPAARTSLFALALRDQLAAALLGVPGIRIAAPPGPAPRLDCTRNDVDYFVGLQVTRTGQAGVRIALRTLDVRANTWVTGYDRSWQGSLTSRQRDALERNASDSYFQGQRTAPFDATQPDVLARKLARELACASMRQLGGEYIVLVDTDPAAALPGITELIGNNLALLGALQFTRDPARANAVLRGKSHAVDRDLGQFWATLAPLDATGELPALTASAYVRMPPSPVASDAPSPVPRAPEPVAGPVEPLATATVPLPPASGVAMPATRNRVLTHANLVTASGRATCRGRGRRCAALQLRSRGTAAVFLLNHQPRHGLVRLPAGACRDNVAPDVIGADRPMTVALHAASRKTVSTGATTSIALRPGSETWYALGIANSRAALDFSRHLRALPQRCTAAARSGLRGAALEAWLGEFARLLDTWRDHVDLRAVRTRDDSPRG